MIIMRLILLTILLTFVHCKENKLSFKDIQTLKTNFQTSINEGFQTQNQNVAICIGASKSGKSTLINYLIGNKLIGNRFFKGGLVVLMKDDDSPGPEISHGFISKTILPSRWKSSHFPDMILLDTPGFDGNRGPVQDITNAFYLYQILQKVKSLKIILVVDIDNIINDNINPFLSVLNDVEKLFRNKTKDYFKSTSVIFTKVPNTIHDVPFKVKFIKALLTDKVLLDSNIKISEVSKEFVQFLVLNTQQIGLFMKAEIGPVTPTIEVNILEAIKNSEFTKHNSLTEIVPSISEESKVVLYEAQDSLYSKRPFTGLQSTISNFLNLTLDRFRNADITREPKFILKLKYEYLSSVKSTIQDIFNPSLRFHQKLESLQSIDSTIAAQIQEQDLLKKAQLMELVDKLLEPKTSNEFDLNLQQICLFSSTEVDQLIVSISLQLSKITEEESKNERYLQDISRIFPRHPWNNLKGYPRDIPGLSEDIL